MPLWNPDALTVRLAANVPSINVFSFAVSVKVRLACPAGMVTVPGNENRLEGLSAIENVKAWAEEPLRLTVAETEPPSVISVEESSRVRIFFMFHGVV